MSSPTRAHETADRSRPVHLAFDRPHAHRAHLRQVRGLDPGGSGECSPCGMASPPTRVDQSPNVDRTIDVRGRQRSLASFPSAGHPVAGEEPTTTTTNTTTD